MQSAKNTPTNALKVVSQQKVFKFASIAWWKSWRKRGDPLTSSERNDFSFSSRYLSTMHRTVKSFYPTNEVRAVT
ncbi:hypothetical protein X777_12034 [Ooceraea biroi]|uniref:Uncharacterized protein n=1 Tax=Ooceraea biroi TaxID=2015173 RepID=A0A026WZ64_OOCBI|nr:hypothetical protein X777_12034 [Ooceraea biroi]